MNVSSQVSRSFAVLTLPLLPTLERSAGRPTISAPTTMPAKMKEYVIWGNPDYSAKSGEVEIP